MPIFENLVLVFIAGFITCLATGFGALPFFLFQDISNRFNVLLWGLSSGIMLSASTFGLIREGINEGGMIEVGIGILGGIILVKTSHRLLSRTEVNPKNFEKGDYKKLILILGILTVHSFPEGIAIGVSFADLNLEGGIEFLQFKIPILAIFMTIAISIHNIPEGTAISIPLKSMGIKKWKMVWWSIFSSLPQPIGAILAFVFVRIARTILPYGFGFAAGAMIYLVLTEFIPEAIKIGRPLPNGGKKELITGIILGFIAMTPIILF